MAKDFMDLTQGKMSMREYTLKFQQLSRYAQKLVSRKRSKIRKFDFGLYCDFVFECKAIILNNDMTSLEW